MIKRIIKILVVTTILVLLCACVKPEEEAVWITTEIPSRTQQVSPIDTNTTIPYTSEEQPIETVYYSETNPTTNNTFTADTTEARINNTSTEAQQNTTDTTQNISESTTGKVYKKTGEMAFSDSADNKYIKAITEKYQINAEHLVAIYTVPDNNGNLVLEFNGKTDSSGKLIRNADTLITIYTIDKNLNSKRASENPLLNEYPYGEMKVMFISTTQYIMPEFETELNG